MPNPLNEVRITKITLIRSAFFPNLKKYLKAGIKFAKMQREKGYSAITNEATIEIVPGTYTLGELVGQFEPCGKKEKPRAFVLSEIPSGIELRAMGKMTKGEIG